ncbi:MAG: hypothetical protein UY71_C0011G0016 [Parcubacteria group bacterium GW2011_GWB1_52_7]|nr:MAG: hypothetical protein UY64_C0054G0006 [Parcubacteria group bacterium GW2011_GWA1_51_12]KKW28765.1 MAG: hypothetical protein UY71_C0011G0016 [Parcubacteria group bacterium GW2011_GWB1_52_7]KKW30074.1 MAG: hypothetical protein UY75_C0044G0006 [Parcubacteria group bacterium GW2011_GWC2_52_8c]
MNKLALTMLLVVLLAAIFYGVFSREDASIIDWTKISREAQVAR